MLSDGNNCLGHLDVIMIRGTDTQVFLVSLSLIGLAPTLYI